MLECFRLLIQMSIYFSVTKMAESGGNDDKRTAVNWADLEAREAQDFAGRDHLGSFARMEVVFDKLKILQFESQLMPSFKRMGYKMVTRY